MNTILFLSLLSGIAAGPTSAITLTEPHAAKGDVRSGMPLIHKFRLTNTSGTAARILEVNSPCGCLRLHVPVRLILPNESAEITVEVNTLSQPAGPNTWRLLVRTSEVSPQGPLVFEHSLKITANLLREVRVDPVSIGLSTAGEIEQLITITDTRSKPLTVTRCRIALPQVRGDILPTKEKGVQQVRLVVAADCPAGHYQETVLLDTDDPDYREIRIPLTLVRRDARQVQAVPDSVTLRLANGQKTATALVRLRDHEERTVVVEKIETETPQLVHKWVPGPGSMATVRVTIDLSSEKEPQEGRGFLRIHLAEPTRQVVLVPVSWLLP